MNDSLDRTMAALAHPTRRAILRRLMRGEARVTDLARPFAVSLNTVSRHIRMLERARLVRRRRAWREHFVSYDPARLDRAAAWIERQRAFWSCRPGRARQPVSGSGGRWSVMGRGAVAPGT